MYILGINPTTEGTGTHDPGVVILEDGKLAFGAEEERFNRDKHARETFPELAIRNGLDFCDIELGDIDVVSVGWRPQEKAKYDIRLDLRNSLLQSAYLLVQNLKDYKTSRNKIKSGLEKIGAPVPPVQYHDHHLCHAASAFYPSGFDQALVLTLDGRGERDSTVLWRGDSDGLERLKSYQFPNSLGGFYSAITVYLGYRANNGEGKVMGLAPYGTRDPEIEDQLRTLIETGVDYDVSSLNFRTGGAVGTLERLFNRPRKSTDREFSDWEKDLAHVSQKLLEETVVEMVETYCREQDLERVCLAGGVALNCKMNKCLMELDDVCELFVQPVAHDAGTAVGAGLLESNPDNIGNMSTVYWGPEYSSAEITDTLDTYKIEYSRPEDLELNIATRLSKGELVGWFQGRLEMGPRALGNRSILANPRTVNSRDRVNKYVKHREEWRPFAPSMLEDAIDDYLSNAEPAPYMIKTFDVLPERQQEISAVLHPADKTTRPQTVREDQNPTFYTLLRQFEELTGVPVLLNTSFNDSGEPIVNNPTEAIRNFFSMGLDTLVIQDVMVEKPVDIETNDVRNTKIHTGHN